MLINQLLEIIVWRQQREPEILFINQELVSIFGGFACDLLSDCDSLADHRRHIDPIDVRSGSILLR